MSAAGRKLFQVENHGARPEEYFYLTALGELRCMDPDKDRLLLENLARNAPGTMRKAALRRLGLTELPPPNPEYISDDLFDESYWVLREQILQVCQMADRELLRTAAFASRSEASCFAFCRLTGWQFTPPECDAYSHRDYACGRVDWMAEEDVKALCREMIEKHGPFVREAVQCLRAQKMEVSLDKQ